jgi:SAM-dependent methyltransferase
MIMQDILMDFAKKYPRDIAKIQELDVPRIDFNINISINAVKPKNINELEICDIGGGIGLFSIGCAVSGMKRGVLIDDFNDPVNHDIGASILDMHRGLGIEIIERDVLKKGIQDIPGTFDIITTFDSMEHWHQSPKRLFHEVVNKLTPNGIFILGVPNCVNLRKRIAILSGKGKWSRMQEWYEPDYFRGHVREPDVSDLKYIARDLHLYDIKILGRNWLGYHSLSSSVRIFTKIVDYPLRLLPSLCSDIYLIGRKV